MDKYSYLDYVRIYDSGITTMAEVTYAFDGRIEIVEWNCASERQRILEQINGYTLIEDTRL